MQDRTASRGCRIRPTWVGWAVWLSAVACLCAGLLRKDPAMMSVGLIAGAAMAMAHVFARVHARALDFQVSLPPHAEAGRRFICRVCVWNTSRWCDVWRLQLQVKPFELVDGDAALAWIAPKDAAVVDMEALVTSRCLIRSVRIEWVTDAPFGLMTARRAAEVPACVLVRPRSVWPWKNHQRGEWGARTAEASRTAGAGEWGEPRGARPWRSGDRARHILWPATLRSVARGSVWMACESDPPVEGWASYTVVFHSYGGGGALIRPESFELSLSHIAGVVRYLLSEGRMVRLVADFDQWRSWECRDAHSLSKLLDHLAVVDRAMGTEAHEVTKVLESVKPEDGIVVISDFPLKWWRTLMPDCARRAWLPDAATGKRKQLEVSR